MHIHRLSSGVALLFALLPGLLSAQETLFTPQHVAKLRLVTSAVISPDGTQVAYTLSVPRQLPKEKDGPSWSELHVVDTKGNSTPFITGPVRIGDISWTPDGKSIAFLAKRDKDETRSLYTIGGRGGEAKRILTHATDITGYSFSGDGKQVAFLAVGADVQGKKSRQDQGFNQEIYEEDQPLTRVWIWLRGSARSIRPGGDATRSPNAQAGRLGVGAALQPEGGQDRRRPGPECADRRAHHVPQGAHRRSEDGQGDQPQQPRQNRADGLVAGWQEAGDDFGGGQA